jgi:hypothetical protein
MRLVKYYKIKRNGDPLYTGQDKIWNESEAIRYIKEVELENLKEKQVLIQIKEHEYEIVTCYKFEFDK